jgi:plastocyanin
MRWKVIIGVLILVVALISLRLFVYTEYGGKSGLIKKMLDSETTSSQVDRLVLARQEARVSVLVDTAELREAGFVVIRGSDGQRLGQVIEISRYLEAGKHENITVALGDFYVYTEDDQLIAMIYHDDGDKAFSELDQPAPNTPAIFVETGESVPASVLEEVAAHGGTGMETVRYTNNGFRPAKLTVPVGTMVEFINQSDNQMWVASNVHPGHDILPTFDQFKGVGKDKTYMYVFDMKGTWAYHDHINPALEGIITVE